MKQFALYILISSSLLFLSSCKKTIGTSSLTAEILNETKSDLYLDIEGMEVHFKGEWVKMKTANGLYDLNNTTPLKGLTFLPEQDVRDGKIDQIRLVIGDSSFYIQNNTTHLLVVPNYPTTYINIPVKVELINLGDYRLVFNAQAEKSIAFIDGAWHLNPNFKLQSVDLY